MNVASRMESTCIPGCLQISQETYDGLSKRISDHFVETYVEVKGRGLMTTYLYRPALPKNINSGFFQRRSSATAIPSKRALVVGETIAVGMQVKEEIEKSGSYYAELGSFDQLKNPTLLDKYDVILINVESNIDISKELGLIKGAKNHSSRATLVGMSGENMSPGTQRKIHQSGIDQCFAKANGPGALVEMLQ